MLKYPPLSASSREANTLGESNRGQQNQSMVPSAATSAAVCRSPISPCSLMSGYRFMGRSFLLAMPWDGDGRTEPGQREPDEYRERDRERLALGQLGCHEHRSDEGNAE